MKDVEAIIARLQSRVAALAETKPDTALVMEAVAFLLARDETVNRMAESFMQQSIEKALKKPGSGRPARPVK